MSLSRVEDRERIKNLNLIRLGIMSAAHEQGEVLKKSEIKENSLQIGDLVLMKIGKREVFDVSIRDYSGKISPKWSVPYRIIEISEDGNNLKLKNLVSHRFSRAEIRDAHIRNIRKISAPQSVQQKEIWEACILNVVQKDIQDPMVYRRILNDFWEKLEEPWTNKKRRFC